MITDEEFIDFACPYCRESVSFPMQQRGTLQQCPMCYESIMTPENPGEAGRAIPVPFTTARLTLRRLATGDWKDLLELLSDEEIYRYTQGIPLDEEAILRWLESDPHVKLTTPDQMFYLGMNLREGDRIIGVVGLRLTAPDLLQAHVMVQLNRAFQRQGFAAEALAGVLHFCFESVRLHRVSASCDTRNEPALKLFSKVGFRKEGEFVKDTLVRGHWATTSWHAILREEYSSK